MPSRFPVHVTVRLRKGLRTLREAGTVALLRRVFEAGCERFGFRLVHFSIQPNHIHMIVEAKGRLALTRGMKGLLVRVARALNKRWGRKGQVFPERYHEHILRTPREVRHALCYVLHNAKKHRLGTLNGVDPFASTPWFDGWRERIEFLGVEDWGVPVAAAHSWLLRKGWRRHGLISVGEEPGARAP